MAVCRFLQKTLAAWALVAVALTPLSCANAQNADTALAGKWIVVMSRQGYDYYVWLTDIARSDKGGGWQAKLTASSNAAPDDASIDQVAIAPPDVRLVFKAGDDKFEFRGKFDNGTVWGIILVGGEAVIPARLISTKASSLKKYDEPQESPGRDAFSDAASKEEPFGPLLRFARQHTDSPLALDAFQELIGRAKSEKYDEAKFRKLIDDYRQTARKWGELIELRAVIDAGVVLSKTDYLPDLALEYLNTAEKMLTKEAPSRWKKNVDIEKGRRLLLGAHPAEGLKLLARLHKEHPFEAEITLPLAQEAEKKKDLDAALELYGELAALPEMEKDVARQLGRSGSRVTRDKLPSRVVARLWKEKHASEEGLSEFLNEIYEQRIRAIGNPRVPPRKNTAGAKVALCELFTGSECPPCLAADLATTVLESTYAMSDVIVLRYHQHNPAPDPLANQVCEERSSAYETQGTPAVFVNGKEFPGAGGFMDQVRDAYLRLVKTVEPILDETTDVSIELSAEANDGKISISARALGSDAFPKSARLRLALSENKIAFVAGNGVRMHDMIVRAMPGGPDGIPAKKGKLSYTGEVDLAKLKTQLGKHLARIESETRSEFKDKPLELKSLHLVAFVQNDDTNEVLQAIAVPVTGDLTTPAPTAPAAAEKSSGSRPPAGGTD